jgi:hypothetical protein
MAHDLIHTFNIPRRRRYDPPRQYDLTVLPTLASAGGKARHKQVQAMSENEQRDLWTRVSVGATRANARRWGHPEPVFVEAELKPVEGGGYELDVSKPYKPLRKEWGGKQSDGTIQIAYPTQVDNTRNNPAAIADAQCLAAQLEAYYAGEATPKRKARSR